MSLEECPVRSVTADASLVLRHAREWLAFAKTIANEMQANFISILVEKPGESSIESSCVHS